MFKRDPLPSPSGEPTMSGHTTPASLIDESPYSKTDSKHGITPASALSQYTPDNPRVGERLAALHSLQAAQFTPVDSPLAGKSNKPGNAATNSHLGAGKLEGKLQQNKLSATASAFQPDTTGAFNNLGYENVWESVPIPGSFPFSLAQTFSSQDRRVFGGAFGSPYAERGAWKAGAPESPNSGGHVKSTPLSPSPLYHKYDVGALDYLSGKGRASSIYLQITNVKSDSSMVDLISSLNENFPKTLDSLLMPQLSSTSGIIAVFADTVAAKQAKEVLSKSHPNLTLEFLSHSQHWFTLASTKHAYLPFNERQVVLEGKSKIGHKVDPEAFEAIMTSLLRDYGPIMHIRMLESNANSAIMFVEFFDSAAALISASALNATDYKGIALTTTITKGVRELYHLFSPTAQDKSSVTAPLDGFHKSLGGLSLNPQSAAARGPDPNMSISDKYGFNKLYADPAVSFFRGKTVCEEDFAPRPAKLNEGSSPLSPCGPFLEPIGTPKHMTSFKDFPTMDPKPIVHPLTPKPRASNSNTPAHHNAVDIERIRHGLDVRTTIMLRNIPNKIDQAMLKGIVDETSRGKYDFMYLRIDFANNCNVGYAFINFEDPLSIVDFVLARAGRRWNRFNSEKIAEVSYATIQGKDCLIQKFRNSSVMLEHPSFRPKIFHTGTGPLSGTEDSFPAPDNPSKMRRSIENAEHVGLFAPRVGQHIRDNQRRRRSQFDRGSRLAEMENLGGFYLSWLPSFVPVRPHIPDMIPEGKAKSFKYEY